MKWWVDVALWLLLLGLCVVGAVVASRVLSLWWLLATE